jgi:methylenetetrahydrofolate dehydrogenase (NADP+)/methenyltetrahydrofolate cyclohydrolase
LLKLSMTETSKIDGRALSAALLDGLAGRVGACKEAGVEPCLAVVLVGEDPASQVYVRMKGKKAAAAGITTRDHKLPDTTTTEELLAIVTELNGDEAVDGILVQLPLPKGCDEEAVLLAIDPKKDVDGFHPENLGRLMIGNPDFVPCTPQGCMLLLDDAGVDLNGAKALVVGRSNIVGKPMATLLTHANATVTVAHSRTKDLDAELAAADVVIAAVGRPKMIRGDQLKAGAVVIDVGINRNEEGKLCGDVDYDSAQGVAAAITPVPGGVGPMTIACLMQNVVISAERRARIS